MVKNVVKKHTAGQTLNRFEQWVLGVYQRRGFNKATVAVANKNARILAAMLASGEAYRPNQAA